MNAPPQMTAQQQIAQARANNAATSALVRDVSQDCKQQIFSTNVVAPQAGNNTLNIPVRLVGLAKGFIVEVTAALTNGGGAVANTTAWNAANILSNLAFFDLDNYQRINCAGWFMNLLGTAKEGFVHGAAILSTAMDSPIKYGSNYNVISAPATIAAAASGTVVMRYWVPLAYSKSDLRGGVFLGVVNATAYLQLTINPAPGIAAGDAVLAVYTGAGSGVTCTSCAITVYQSYLDQLPRYSSGPMAGAPILPQMDMATQYRLNTTALSGVIVNQDFPIPFTNFQQFLSLGVIYDQAGVLNAGTDIASFALAAANTYQTFKYGPIMQAFLQRIKMMTDLPLGSYLFDFRDQPISTNQTGNMQILLNAITAAVGTNVQCGFENFALTNAVLGAASLPAS